MQFYIFVNLNDPLVHKRYMNHLDFLLSDRFEDLQVHSPHTVNHCVKSLRVRSFSGLHFPAFGHLLRSERDGKAI